MAASPATSSRSDVGPYRSGTSTRSGDESDVRHVTVHEAKTHLSRLLNEIEAGGTIIITRRGKPIATMRSLRRRPRFGSMKDRISFDESFFDPLPEDELRALEGE